MTTLTADARPVECEHDERFKYEAIGGHRMCEMCARIEASWTECTSIGCVELTPPDVRRCTVHGADEIIQCPSCKGSGEEEIECTHCDGLGYENAECEQCDGAGEINKEDAE